MFAVHNGCVVLQFVMILIIISVLILISAADESLLNGSASDRTEWRLLILIPQIFEPCLVDHVRAQHLRVADLNGVVRGDVVIGLGS